MGYLSAIGPTIIFVFSLAAATILSMYVFSYAAHCFLVVMESTAAGMDEIRWPDELFLDWLWKPPYLLGLLGIWVLAGFGVLLLAAPRLAATWPGILGVLAVAAWIFFPITLYSSLSARSLAHVLYGPLLRRLVRRLGLLLVLYVLTGPLIGAAAAIAFLAVSGPAFWLPLAGLFLPMALFVHARLLGRLAWVIGYRTPLNTRKARKRVNPLGDLKVEVNDPWSLPSQVSVEPLDEFFGLAPVEQPGVEPDGVEATPAKTADNSEKEQDPAARPEAYRVMSDDEAKESWHRTRKEATIDSGYAVAPAEQTADAAATTEPTHALEPSRPLLPEQPQLLEHRLQAENQPAPPPKVLFWSGVLTFPFYPHCLRPMFGLAVGCFSDMFFVRLMVQMPLQ